MGRDRSVATLGSELPDFTGFIELGECDFVLTVRAYRVRVSAELASLAVLVAPDEVARVDAGAARTVDPRWVDRRAWSHPLDYGQSRRQARWPLRMAAVAFRREGDERCSARDRARERNQSEVS